MEVFFPGRENAQSIMTVIQIMTGVWLHNFEWHRMFSINESLEGLGNNLISYCIIYGTQAFIFVNKICLG